MHSLKHMSKYGKPKVKTQITGHNSSRYAGPDVRSGNTKTLNRLSITH